MDIPRPPDEYFFSLPPAQRNEPPVQAVTARIKLPPFDPWLFLSVFVLTVGGLPILFSASYAIGIEQYKSASYFVLRQVVWGAVGFAGLYLASCVDLRRLRAASPFLYVLTLLMLAAVLFTPLGVTHEHVRRWLHVPSLPLSFQPSELAKIVFILVLAHCLGIAVKNSHFSWWTWGGVVLLTAPIIGLIFPEPHLSTSILILLTMVAMVFLAGARLRQMIGVFVGLGMLAVLTYFIMPDYQKERIKRYLSGGDHKNGNYQVHQSETALKEGDLLGKGFCQSQRKLFFLPASHTDFIFAIIGEEFGLLGTLLTLSVFGFLIFKCYHLALQAEDPFCALLCAGIGTLIALQVVINVGVVTHVLPTTGVPLPFISSGGSALFCTLLGMGLVLNVSRMPKQITWSYHDATTAGGRRNRGTHLSSARAR